MTKSVFVLVTLAVLLVASSLSGFTNLLNKPNIQILAQIRPGRSPSIVGFDRNTQVWPVSFVFSQKFQLTEVTVVAVDDLKTNIFPHVLWHLISDSNSIPVKALVYGSLPPQGMKPKVPRARPDPLKPDVRYRLTVKAGDQEGVVDFQTHEVVQPAAPEQ